MTHTLDQRPNWDRVIRTSEQKRILDVGHTHYYEIRKDPNFPKEIVLGKRARGCWLSELYAFIESRKSK